MAINKCDKPNVNAKKIKEDLIKYNIIVEELGGDVPCVHVSGLTGIGLDELEETILTISEVAEFKADSTGCCEGTIVESNLTREKGFVATVLVNRGTLKPGSIIVSGTSWAKVKNLIDASGNIIESAGPSEPVEVMGWRTLPGAGDIVLESPSEQIAKKVVENRERKISMETTQRSIEIINEKREIERERLEKIREIEKENKEKPKVFISINPYSSQWKILLPKLKSMRSHV